MSTTHILTLPASMVLVGDRIISDSTTVYDIDTSILEPGNLVIASGHDGKVGAKVCHPTDLITVERRITTHLTT